MIREELDLKQLEQTLKEMRAVLMARLRVKAKANSTAVVNPDRTDLAQDYFLQDRRVALVDSMEDTLERVERALESINTGVYGKCERCGNDISASRLEALPYVNLCIGCQEKEERISFVKEKKLNGI